MFRLQELVRLHRMGVGRREAARLLKMSPNTERRYRDAIIKAELYDGDPKALPSQEALQIAVTAHIEAAEPVLQNISSIIKWREPIEKMLEKGAQPRSIFDKLRLEKDFKGSLSAVKRLCLQIKKAQPPKATDVVIPVNTEPGKVAQVDFGYVGKLFDPLSCQLRKAWVFLMVLGYSRHMFAAIVFDQKVTTWSTHSPDPVL